MPKMGKNWVKPGFLAAKTTYERQRANRIDENNERLNALGLKNLATSLIGSSQPKSTNKRGKNVRDTEYHDSYIPSDSEDDDDDDSYDHLEQEVSEMPPRKRLIYSDSLRSPPIHQRNPTVEEDTLPIDEMGLQHGNMLETPSDGGSLRANEIETPPSQAHCNSVGGSLRANEIETPPSQAHCNSVGSTARRGQTRGVKTQRLIEKEGKLLVPIPAKYRQPVGKYANCFASATGIQIRQHLPDLSVRRWSNVPATSAGPILQRLADEFNLQGDPNDVKKAVNMKCGRRLSDWTHRLRKKYLEMKRVKGEDYTKRNPPKDCSLDQWTLLINNKWNDPKFLHQSAVNTANRARQVTNHSCGSKSMAVRANEEENKGEPLDMLKFYRTTHYNLKKNQWARPACESEYEALKKKQEDHCSQPHATPLTAEDLSVQVLGAKSGRLKGLGMRPSTSRRTTVESSEDSEHVKRLTEQVEELQAANQSQAKQMAEQMASMMAWMRSKGYDGAEGSSGAEEAS